MRLVPAVLLGLALLLAPVYAALPDDLLPPAGSYWLSGATFAAVLVALVAVWRGDRTLQLPFSRAEQGFLVLLGLALLSIPARLIAQQGAGYAGVMLHGWSVLAANATAFALARRIAQDRGALYGLALVAVLASGSVAEQGVLEYLPFLLRHQTTWRVYGTSTPDFLAGYLVMLLPLTLALFLQAPGLRAVPPLARRAGTALFGLILLLQLAALVATGSRFALVSLAVALAVFEGALLHARRHGQTLDQTTRGLRVALGVGLLLAGLVFARPVFLRLTNPDPNSGAFRVWTWRGAARMAAANPVLGTGIGTWSDLYPRYALTGFTRAAHQSYLQLADECGTPALLALLATLGLLGVSLVRGLAVAPAEALPLPEPVKAVSVGRRSKRPAPPVVAAPAPGSALPSDHRLLLCGLLAALAGGVVQNLSDSDWYVFFLGFTFWTLAGLAAGIVAAPTAWVEAKPPRPLLFAAGSVVAALAALAATGGVGAVYAAQAAALAKTDPSGAASAYEAARAWDPLNARYASDQGHFFARQQGQLTEAETAARAAVALAPNSVNYRRLGDVLQQFGRQDEALAAYQGGLRAEPHSLELLLRVAHLSPPAVALGFYRRVSDLEQTPVGTVRALSEYVETDFAEADTVMGDDAAKTDPARAMLYYARAARVLEQYAEGHGSGNFQQMALHDNAPDPAKDAGLGGLYQHVLTAWRALAPPDEQAVLRQRQEKYQRMYADLTTQPTK